MQEFVLLTYAKQCSMHAPQQNVGRYYWSAVVPIQLQTSPKAWMATPGLSDTYQLYELL